MRRLAALALVPLALVACAASDAPAGGGVEARVAGARSLEAGLQWTPTIRLRRGGRPLAAPRPVLVLRGAGARATAAVTATRTAGTFRARVRVPAAGRWTWTLAVRGREVARGTLAVRTPRFGLPYGVDADAAGNVYVGDGERKRVLRLDSAGRLSVHATGVGETTGLAAAPDGTVYATDFPAHRIRRIDPAGRVTTIAGSGREGWSGDGGPATRADLGLPAAVALDGRGGLVVVTLGSYVRRIDLAAGTIETIAGDGRPEDTGDGGPARAASVETPHGVTADAQGNVFLTAGHRIRRIDAATGTIATIAGTGVQGTGGDGGPARLAQVDAYQVGFAADGTLYFSGGDPDGGSLRRIRADGIVELVAGNHTLAPRGDGRARDVGMLPTDLAFLPDGSLVFGQTAPEPSIRRIDVAAGTVATIVRGS
jgi:serine/threonine-protein kinase